MQVLQLFVVFLARALNLAILARVLLSWIPIDRDSRVIQILYEITEPIMGPIRRVMPNLGGLDISPMVALILVQVIERVLISMFARF